MSILKIFSFSLIQGVANEVLAISVVAVWLIIYLSRALWSFIRNNPIRINRNNDNAANNLNNFENECVSNNSCSICLGQTQYELTTSCFHLFCGSFFFCIKKK